MTLIRNPIKTTGTVGTAIAATVAIFTLTAAPSLADRDAQPIALPEITWPQEVTITQEMIDEGFAEFCDAKFNVDENGYVETPIEVKCSDPAFENSVRAATVNLRFEPKVVDGEAIRRTRVIYPYQFALEQDPSSKSRPHEQQIFE